MVEALELAGIGMLAGGLGALLGVGGGVILVPGLIFLAGLDFSAAVATSLVCVVATSVAGSAIYLRQDAVDLPIAVELQCFTVLGAVAAGLSAAVIPVAPLYLAFALLLAVTAIRMWPREADRNSSTRVHHVPTPVATGASVGAGLVSGLLATLANEAEARTWLESQAALLDAELTKALAAIQSRRTGGSASSQGLSPCSHL